MKILGFWIVGLALAAFVLFSKWKSCRSIIDGSATYVPWFWPCGTNRVADADAYFTDHTVSSFYDKAHQDAGMVYGPIAVAIDESGEVS
jgi:hypothetical protein